MCKIMILDTFRNMNNNHLTVDYVKFFILKSLDISYVQNNLGMILETFRNMNNNHLTVDYVKLYK